MTAELINTLEAPGEFDALTSLRPREPYFLLVGRDRLAPKLVNDWADANRRRALDEYSLSRIDADKLKRELRKSTQAEMIAASMVEFKNNWQAREEAAAATPAYTGHELPEETKRRDRLQSVRARAASAINAAVAELSDLLEAARDVPEHADLESLVSAALPQLRELSDEVTPKRPIGVAA